MDVFYSVHVIMLCQRNTVTTFSLEVYWSKNSKVTIPRDALILAEISNHKV